MSNDVFFPYAFEAPIEKFGVGKTRVIWYNVLMVPDEVCAELPLDEYPRLRIEGEIAEVPIANALMPTGDGRRYVIVSPTVLKEAEVRLGDHVEMRFRIADQDHVDVPAGLSAALRNDRNAAAMWEALTPGKKRMLSQHVLSAKTEPTQAKRIGEALDALLNHGADLRALRYARKKRKPEA
ncbi:MAG: YdeI/OmpD-associated family protein [Pseudomonadota bacterium]